MEGSPSGASGKETTYQRRRHKRLRFDPWVRKIPWMRAWQPTSVFLPGGSHRQRSLAGYSKHSHEQLDATEATYTHSTVELIKIHTHAQGFSCSSVGKESACSEGHPGSIPGLGGSPGEGNGDPLQYPCLENLMEREAYWARIHGVTKSRAWLSD